MSEMTFPGPKGRLWTTYNILARPFEAMIDWRDRYGDPFLVHAVNGDIVCTGRPDLIKELFAAPAEQYDPFGVEALAPLLGAGSVLGLRGQAHRRERKLLMPPFHGARMKAYAATMHEVADRHLTAASGAPTTMQKVAQALTLEIIMRTVFGIARQDELRDAMDAVLKTLDAVHPAFLFMPFLQRDLFGLGPWGRFRRALARTDAMLQKQIDARRKRGDGDDILGLLLAARYEDGEPMVDSDIRDELRTLVVAGHETTAMTLGFMVDALYRNPDVLDKARAEVDAHRGATPQQLGQLPYLDAVVKESLRMRPIITEAMRTLTTTARVGPVDVPAGKHIAASMVLAHYNPDTYPEPTRFRPDRFLERRFSPSEYLPFGGGHRRCIGAAFAEMELRIVLAQLVGAFELELVSPVAARPVRRNASMAPKDGVPVRLRRRRAFERTFVATEGAGAAPGSASS